MKLRFIQASLYLGIGNILVTLANLGRDVAIATAFGTTLAVDSFFLAIMLPLLVLTVGIGAFRSTIVPILEKAVSSEDGVAQLIVGRLLTVNVGVILGIALFFALAVNLYAPIIAGRLDQEAVSLIKTLTWASLPMIALSGLAALGEGPLQTRGSYFVPSIVRASLPIGIVVGALMLAPHHGVFGLCIGGGLGAGIQAMLSLMLLYRHGLLSFGSKKLARNLSTDIRNQFVLLSVGMSIVYVSPVVDQWMASFLGAGAVSTLSYASRLAIGIASITTGSLGPALLPHFSRKVAFGDMDSINATYIKFVRVAVWAGWGLAGVVWLISDPIIVLLYEGGSFTRDDSRAVASVLTWFCLQFPPLLVSTAGFTLLQAMSLNKYFVPLSILNATVNALGNLLLMRWLGVGGIALSTAITYGMSMMTMNLLLHRRGVIRVPASVMKDFVISSVLATSLGIALIMLDGRPAMVPDWRQFAMSALAFLCYVASAYFVLRPVLSGLFRGVRSLDV